MIGSNGEIQVGGGWGYGLCGVVIVAVHAIDYEIVLSDQDLSCNASAPSGRRVTIKEVSFEVSKRRSKAHETVAPLSTDLTCETEESAPNYARMRQRQSVKRISKFISRSPSQDCWVIGVL